MFDTPMFLEEAPRDTRGTFASFGLHPQKNEQKSLSAGRPIYDDVEYVQILVAGDKTNVVHRPASPEDKAAYPKEYAAFKAGQDQEAVSGTPLSSLPGITRGLVEEARYFNVRTIEQLASISDGSISNLGMGWPALRQKARDYIAAAEGAAPLDKMRAENSELRNQIEALQRQMSEVVAAQGKQKAK